MKKISIFALLITMISICFSNPIQAESEEPKQIKVYFTCDYQNILGQNGHTFPNLIEHFPQNIKWGSFNITVIDSQGNTYKVPTKTSGYQLLYLDKTFPEGETITVKIDPKDIPEGFHLSGEYNSQLKKFEFFERHYTIVSGKPYADSFDVRIGLGKTDIVFDLDGGSVNGSTDRIMERINTNNTVNFPKPVKENLEYVGKWYTETEKGRYLFDESTLFSDYSHEWQKYNLESFDPRYDGKFILRPYYAANITFDTKGGSEIKGGLLYEGKKVTIPSENPVKEGFTFVRWNDKNNNPFDFDQPIHANTTIYASWTDIPNVDPIKSGDKNIKVGTPLEADKIVITLPDSTTVVVKKDKKGSWKTDDENTVTIENGKLVIPVDANKITEGSTVKVNTEKDNVPSEIVTVTVQENKVVTDNTTQEGPNQKKYPRRKISTPKTGYFANTGFYFAVSVLSLGTIALISKKTN